MDNKYEKAIKMLKAEHKCPSDIAYECGIERNVLRNATDGCFYEDCVVNCDFCRENALEYMIKEII